MIVLDIETSGLCPEKNGVWQIGAIDLTNPESFGNIPLWYSEIKKNINLPEEEITGFIIGNKKDLKNKKITSEGAQKLAEQFNLMYLETSALSGENVDHAFTTLAKKLFESRK